MSQDEYSKQKPQIEKRLELLRAIVLIVIGIIVVASSVLFGKEWNWGELIYDLGMAVVIAALVEVLIMRTVSSLRPGWMNLLDDTNILINELQDYTKEMEEKTLALTIKGIDRTVESIEGRLERLDEGLEAIRLAVDTDYKKQKDISAALDRADAAPKE